MFQWVSIFLAKIPLEASCCNLIVVGRIFSWEFTLLYFHHIKWTLENIKWNPKNKNSYGKINFFLRRKDICDNIIILKIAKSNLGCTNQLCTVYITFSLFEMALLFCFYFFSLFFFIINMELLYRCVGGSPKPGVGSQQYIYWKSQQINNWNP